MGYTKTDINGFTFSHTVIPGDWTEEQNPRVVPTSLSLNKTVDGHSSGLAVVPSLPCSNFEAAKPQAGFGSSSNVYKYGNHNILSIWVLLLSLNIHQIRRIPKLQIFLDSNNQLPQGAEATIDVLNPAEQVQYLSKAFDQLQKPLEKFVVEHSPDWLVVDLVNPQPTDVGKDFGVPVLGFSVFSAAACLFLGPPEYLIGDVRKRVRPSFKSLTSPPEWVTFPSSVAYHNFEAPDSFFGWYGENASGMSFAERIAKTINSCQAVATRNSRELGGEYLSLYAKLIGKPVIPIGLLPPENPKELQITDESWIETFKWLDQQEPKSVVFVGFGSECRLSREQVHEIAYGLEESELPFLWVLRKPHWAKDDFDALPPRFSQRIDFHKQKVCIGWAPQKEILGHPSIGGSLFHAGWGSAIETLQFGHCLVVLPILMDQGLNARFLVEKGLAIEIERGEEGSFKRSDIAMALRQAMARKEGEGMRAHSRDVAAVVGDQELHDGYVAEFVEYLKKGVGKKK